MNCHAADEWSLLDPDGPLLRFRILELGASGAAGALRIDRRMMGYLRGRNRIDERLRPILSALDAVAVPSAILDVVHSTSRWLADPERSSGRVVVNLVGSSADTRSACAAHLMRMLGLHPMRLHLDRLLSRTESHDLLRLVEREAILLQAGTYVDVGPGWGEDTATATAAQELIDELDGLVVVGSDQRVEVEGEAHVVPVPSLTSADRVALWVEALGRTIPGLERVVEQFALGPTGIVRAAREAEVIAEHERRRRDHRSERVARLPSSRRARHGADGPQAGAGRHLGRSGTPRGAARRAPRHGGAGGQPQRRVREVAVRGESDQGPWHLRPLHRPSGHGQDDGGRDHRSAARPRPLPHRSRLAW